ncbi:MAG: STAS domain-containing protein [Clostridia bacterium]|nr:STAS domain-containing protein [Clostridia bacterium]
MQINKVREGSTLTVSVTGRLDTITAPELEAALTDLSGVDLLVLNFAGLEYVSSAGLRVLLKTSKRMRMGGNMICRNVNDMIMEIFDITGFSEILTIE